MAAKILIVRNDKLGDFVLALPVFKLVKQTMPDYQIHALVPLYTQPVAECCPYIDHVLIDTASDSKAFKPLFKAIKAQNYDAIITLYSTTRVGMAAWLARIPQRFAPATKLAQIFYNYALTQRRSRSEKPEYQYNLDLGRFFLEKQGYPDVTLPSQPFLEFKKHTRQKIQKTFSNVPADHQLIFIHPGSGGSASNLSLEQYAMLARNLKPVKPATIVISCGPGELNIAQQFAGKIPDLPHIIYHSTEGLEQFALHILEAAVFISGSTGTLHLAGALDVPTAAFYPRRRSATSLRWQTLNSESKRLAFSPGEKSDESDMQSIDVQHAAKKIQQHYQL